MINLAKKTSAD